jgi:two-component system, LytTR family, response regulator
MAEVNILVADGNPLHSSKLQTQLTELGYYVIDIVDNVPEGVLAFYASEPDLIIIDTVLKGGTSGFGIAEKIIEDELGAKPIIFISSDRSDQTFEKAKKYRPSAYFIKPFDNYLIRYAIELALQNNPAFNKPLPPDRTEDRGIFNSENLFIKKTKKIIKVPLKEVMYIEVESKYSTLFTSLGKFLLRISLKELMEKLPQNLFIRVHRNYIVNLNAIVEFDFDEYTVHVGSSTIPVGRSFKNIIMEQLLLLS